MRNFSKKKKFLDLSDSMHCGIKTHMHTENFENSELVKIVNCKFRKLTNRRSCNICIYFFS